MSTSRNVALIGLVALLPALAVAGGCSSSSDPENAGGDSNAGTNSSAGTPAVSGGGSPAVSGNPSTAAGTSNAGTNGTPTAGSGNGSGGTGAGNPDPSCVSNSTAKEGAMCTQDCMVTCGHNMLGTKTCTCVGGIFDNCSCPRPASYMGAATAPLCPTADNMTAGLKDMPCEVEWEQCIGADPTSGPTKQGCACLKEDATSPLKWECGSSNQWYTLAP